ncbi:MAG TPA: acetyl-CoA C-acetyltransferase [Desulfobacterales bacterium]|nr:acetyl-CoA C-acetyltransferase [Desulfobacterales bacterium]
MKEAVIVGFLRSPFSRSRPKDPDRDVFNSLSMDELGAMVVNELFNRTGLNKGDVDEFLTGCALGVAENWMWGGRKIPLLAEFPETVPTKMIDQQCVSSMATIHMGAMEIMLGYSNVVVSVGVEHMTHIPMADNPMLVYNDKFFTDPRYARYDMSTAVNMGLTAEKLAEQSGISREEMDLWSMRSHQRATQARENGFFKEEILPIEVKLADGERVIDSDVSIRPDTNMDGLSGLKTVFKEGGVITAGNSSPLNAGVSALIIMNKDEARKRGMKPLAIIRSMASAGVDPSIMGQGPIPSSRKALEMAGLSVDDIDIWEINEAFSVVTLNAIKVLGIDPEKVNIRGGAIAIGHPLGATGTRLVGTLARILNLEKKHYGLATACAGGGQGGATIIERED